MTTPHPTPLKHFFFRVANSRMLINAYMLKWYPKIQIVKYLMVNIHNWKKGARQIEYMRESVFVREWERER